MSVVSYFDTPSLDPVRRVGSDSEEVRERTGVNGGLFLVVRSAVIQEPVVGPTG